MNVAYAVTTYTGPRLVETVHYIPKGERLLVIDNSQYEKSLAFCWNYAYDRLITHEGFDCVLVMNDDVIVAPDTANLLATALLDKQFHEERPRKDRMILLLSAWNLRDYERGTIENPPRYTPHDFIQDFTTTENPFRRKFLPRWGTGPDYSCFMFGKALFEQVGRFDESFPVYFEDNDSHYRIGMSGYEALSYAPYYHYGSQTINSSPEMQESGRIKFEKSRDLYVQKWGGMPGEELHKTPFGRY